jgi:hypothetical protein
MKNPNRARLIVSLMLSAMLAPMPASAADNSALLKDLTSVITLLGEPCGEVVSARKQADNDHIATCKNGARYRVYVRDGRVVAQKHKE